MIKSPLQGLFAAVPSPMRADSSLNLKPIQAIAEHLVQEKVSGVYVAATAGECYSLMLEERQRLAAWWAEVIKGTPLKLIVHVGHHCLADARELAAHAAKVGATAVAAGASSYFKPTSVDRLMACCEAIASGANGLPFYFDHIPQWTGVQLSMVEFLGLSRNRINNLAGVIHSDPDISDYQNCLCFGDGAFDAVFGHDESLMAGLALGARAAISSTAAIAAPIYRRMIEAYREGDHEAARMEQSRASELIAVLNRYHYLVGAKAVMAMIGIDCGRPRLPLAGLTPSQQNSLRHALDRIEFFEWVGPYHMHARQPTDPGQSKAA